MRLLWSDPLAVLVDPSRTADGRDHRTKWEKSCLITPPQSSPVNKEPNECKNMGNRSNIHPDSKPPKEESRVEEKKTIERGPKRTSGPPVRPPVFLLLSPNQQPRCLGGALLPTTTDGFIMGSELLPPRPLLLSSLVALLSFPLLSPSSVLPLPLPTPHPPTTPTDPPFFLRNSFLLPAPHSSSFYDLPFAEVPLPQPTPA